MNLLKHPKLRGLLDNPALFNGVRWFLTGDQNYTRGVVRELLSLKPGEKVLDVCCGTGDFANIVDGTSYVGIDLNVHFVKFASERFLGDPNKQFLVVDALKNGFDSKSFEKALFINSLHHFEDKQAQIILKEIARITIDLAIMIDLRADIPNPIKRTFALLDRGDYVRPVPNKKQMIEKYFDIIEEQTFCTRLAEQVLFVCKPKTN